MSVRLLLGFLLLLGEVFLSGCLNGNLSSFSPNSTSTPSFLQMHSFNGVSSYDQFASAYPTVTTGFTVEFFFKLNSLATNQYLFGANPVNVFYVYVNTAGAINFAGPGAGCSSVTNTSVGGVIVANTLYHLAYVIDSSNIGHIYLNGAPIPQTVTLTPPCALTAFVVGATPAFALNANGYIEELRISNTDRSVGGGASFNVPTVPYVPDGNTLVLIHMNSLNTVDFSSIGNTLNSSVVGIIGSFLP